MSVLDLDFLETADCELYADSARGVYIPQFFAESVKRGCVTGVSAEEWKTLESGPDAENEWYWEAWESVLNNAKIEHPDGRKGYLWQDGDLWVVWEGPIYG